MKTNQIRYYLLLLGLLTSSNFAYAETSLKMITSKDNNQTYFRVSIDKLEPNGNYKIWNLSKNKQIGSVINKSNTSDSAFGLVEISADQLADKIAVLDAEGEILLTQQDTSKVTTSVPILKQEAFVPKATTAATAQPATNSPNKVGINDLFGPGKQGTSAASDLDDQSSYVRKLADIQKDKLKSLRKRNQTFKKIIQQSIRDGSIDCEKSETIKNKSVAALCTKLVENNSKLQEQLKVIKQLEEYKAKVEGVMGTAAATTPSATTAKAAETTATTATAAPTTSALPAAPLSYEDAVLKDYYERSGPVQDKLVELGVKELHELGIPVDKNIVEYGKKLLESKEPVSPYLMAAVALFIKSYEHNAQSFKETEIYAPTANALGSIVWEKIWNNNDEIKKLQKIIEEDKIQVAEDHAKLVIKAIEDKTNKSKQVNKGIDPNSKFNFIEQTNSTIKFTDENYSVEFLSAIPRIAPKTRPEIIISFPLVIPDGAKISFKYDDGTFVISDQRSPDGTVRITKRDNNINDLFELSTDGYTWFDDIKYHELKNDQVIRVRVKENPHHAFYNFYNQIGHIDFNFNNNSTSSTIRINLATTFGCNADQMSTMDYQGKVAPAIFKNGMNEQCFAVAPLSFQNADDSWEIRGTSAKLPMSPPSTEVKKDCRELFFQTKNAFNREVLNSIPYKNPFSGQSESKLQGYGCDTEGEITYTCELGKEGGAGWKYKSGSCSLY